MVLPTQEEMESDIESDYKWRLSLGMPHRHAHVLGSLQWSYHDDLAHLADFEPLDPVIGRLYEHVHGFRTKQLTSYKTKNFEVTGEGSFKELV